MYLKFKNETIICEPLSVTGQVMGFTKELSIHNKIIVKLDKDICPGTLIGTHIDIETDKIRNGFYEILSAELNEQGLYELNIGDISLIRAFEDPADKGKGYRYNISEGAKMRIALAKEI